ncbi:formamidopyrimidine-DNA glycosylase [Candidatus Phytoplasma luffae]|uniref:Formamidopyrimidine-DNA glycosylase n=1 Tax=Loofah witches'-broom phytoplasma TaxID=35773 RepID=A0A975FJZ8_LOWBP|nr:DNA-formamidopyrimidine glycosylase [Candidatus Phytoplasma luffae]QTX03251.1 formamidopyrimidine-DNA glycosylase [Candidatus Phytoplasma luffae]
MPELPEVESTIISLKQKILGDVIKEINIFYPPSFQSVYNLEALKDKKILDIQRKGKFLLFFLESDWVLVGHFRMEGKIYINFLDECRQLHKYENFRIILTENRVLRYFDFRKFGRFVLYKKEDYLIASGLNQLALDPFLIDFEKFFQVIKKKKIAIKKILLDQKIISGIGNIYASEILFLAKINPETLSCDLNKEQVKNIISISKKVLKKAIEFGGTSISTFEAVGKRGSYQQKLLVYRKDKQNCVFCSEVIQKKKIGGRSTYFCPQCQKNIL